MSDGSQGGVPDEVALAGESIPALAQIPRTTSLVLLLLVSLGLWSVLGLAAYVIFRNI